MTVTLETSIHIKSKETLGQNRVRFMKLALRRRIYHLGVDVSVHPTDDQAVVPLVHDEPKSFFRLTIDLTVRHLWPGDEPKPLFQHKVLWKMLCLLRNLVVHIGHLDSACLWRGAEHVPRKDEGRNAYRASRWQSWLSEVSNGEVW
jgi:hypothetical protein